MELAFSTPSRGKVVLVIAVLAVVILVLVTVLVLVTAYWYMSRPQYPWLFKGAYAVYKGGAFGPPLPLEVTLRLEVMDFNKTHAKILFYAKVSTPIGSAETQEVKWVDLTKGSYSSERSMLERVYEEERYIEGLGVRKLTVYEFKLDGGTEVVYVDSGTLWPVMVTYKDDMFGFRIDLNIVETNIPGLKRR
jgi:hypothetical protein